jgi:hypothetical protein
MFCNFKIYDSDFFAFGILVHSCKVIDSRKFKRELDEYAVDFLLKLFKYSC